MRPRIAISPSSEEVSMRMSLSRLVIAGAIVLAAWGSGPAAQSDSLTCPPDPTCDDRCRLHAEEIFRACVAAGGDPEACAVRARAALDACVAENCRPDPTCEERCKAKADGFFRLCVEAGHPRDACAERTRVVLTVCIEEHCVPGPTCEERCRARSEELYRTCVAAGIDPTLCGERARAAFDACVTEHCLPCICPDIYDPVCGVDGRTYSSACAARCAGVEIAYPGECAPQCRCNAHCPAGSVCRDNKCQRPCGIACLVRDPVCGSDGHTYDCGAADAACHGVTVLYPGECRPVCSRDAECPIGAVCRPAALCTNACGCASFCAPCACPRILDPVCGTNGKTYPNACEARCAHVEIAYRGACRTTSSRMLLF